MDQRPRYRIDANRQAASRRVRYVETNRPDDGLCTLCQLDEGSDTMSLHIRPANADDAELLLRLIRELAIYEKAEHEVKTDAAGLRASLFAEDSSSHALICERDGEPIGYAVYFFSYSTWLGRHGLYLEDLYISPEARGCGAGKALLRHLARLAVERGCGRVEWAVLDWNQPAIDFYRALGARPQDEWTTYRLTGQALLDFAAGTQ